MSPRVWPSSPSGLPPEGLVPFTLNGFPYGDFHESVVKQRVYHPTWFDSDRVNYTLNLIRDPPCHSSRIARGEHLNTTDRLAVATALEQQWLAAARHLGQVADQLAQLEENTGRLITLCLEPEPGCLLQRMR